MKKNELINQFIKTVGSYRSAPEYRNASKRVLVFFGLENGGYVVDVSRDDFYETKINSKRASQIAERSKQQSILTASMISDFIVNVGGKTIELLDRKNEVERKEIADKTKYKKVWFHISKESIDAITKESKRTGVPISTLLESAINYYCDLDDSEK